MSLKIPIQAGGLRYISFAFVAITWLMAACTVPVGPSTKEMEGLHITLVRSSDTVANGDSLLLRVTLRNITGDTVSLTSGSSCFAGPSVYRDGKHHDGFVGTFTGGCLAAISGWDVAPRDSLVREWSIGVGANAVDTPTGEYSVRVMFMVVPELGALEDIFIVR